MLYDSDPGGILAYQKRRDQSLRTDDRFMWILDTFLDGRTGYFFEVNPAGLLGDGLITGSGSRWGTNKDWNGIWDARVIVTEQGWSVEVAIPFRTLNFNPTLDTWGINFQRTVRRKNEDAKWSGYERNKQLTTPIHAGHLKGLKDLTQGRGIELKPYISMNNKAMPSEESDVNTSSQGKKKILFDPDTKKVLGVGIVGPSAGDIISEGVLAIEMGADAVDVGLTVHPHPTLGETTGMAAEAFEGTITDLYVCNTKMGTVILRQQRHQT